MEQPETVPEVNGPTPDEADAYRDEVAAYMREHTVDSRKASEIIGLSGRTAMHYYVRLAPDGGPGILRSLMKLNGGHMYLLKDVEELRERLIRDGHAKNRRPR